MFDKFNMYQKNSILVILILIILILSVYWSVQSYDFISYDDPIYVTKNSYIQSGITLDGLRWAVSTRYFGLWNPLVWLSYMFDFQLFGFNAGGYHWTNVIIHIFNTILLFLFFRNSTGSIWRSAFVAALFAIHPINVESVAWISERKNVLSTFFWMLTMLSYVWYVKHPNWKRYIPVIGSFALGLMSKPMLVTLPFVLLLIDYWPLNRTAINTQNEKNFHTNLKSRKEKLSLLIWEKLPLFILSALSIWVIFYLPQSASVPQFERTIEDSLLIQRIINAIFAYGMYLKKLFWPSDLFIPYLYLHIPIWQVFLSAALLIIITIYVCKYIKKYPYLPVGWFWYLGTLVPVVGIFQIGEHTIADRYAYITFIGIFVIIAWGTEQIASKKNILKRLFTYISITMILILAAVAYNQQKLWSNSVSLFEETIKKDPKNYGAYTLMGKEMATSGKYEKALFYYDMALENNPRAYASYNNKGAILQRMGKHYEAIEIFKKAVQLNKYQNRAYYTIALLYFENNDLDESIAYSSKAIEVKPDYIGAYNLLGVTLLRKGRIQEGISQFEKALRINPNDISSQKNLKMAMEIKKKNKNGNLAP